ncbi:MAG TPA: sulfotransferase domain-containing protein, partial [Candidatus Binataceae bacterium]|nr:sulfotransferase domain-containing protein [Candidatus Binataceae bacterium]
RLRELESGGGIGCNFAVTAAASVDLNARARRGTLPRRPEFLAVGPPRTATTWLDQALRGHVGLPANRKETDFFKRNYARGIDWYLDYFRDCPPDLPCGEVCPTLFQLPEARERVVRDFPEMRIIVTLRDPVARAYSYYRFMRKLAWVSTGFEEAVESRRDIRDGNRYAHHIREWQRLFGADRVLVLINDDLRISAQGYIDRFCDFVGAPRFRLDESISISDEVNGVARAPRNKLLAQAARQLRTWLGDHNWHGTNRSLERLGVWRFCQGGGQEFPPLDVATDARVRALFAAEVEQLERLIGRDLSAWRTPRRE